jgi:hypothetical protein
MYGKMKLTQGGSVYTDNKYNHEKYSIEFKGCVFNDNPVSDINIPRNLTQFGVKKTNNILIIILLFFSIITIKYGLKLLNIFVFEHKQPVRYKIFKKRWSSRR